MISSPPSERTQAEIQNIYFLYCDPGRRIYLNSLGVTPSRVFLHIFPLHIQILQMLAYFLLVCSLGLAGHVIQEVRESHLPVLNDRSFTSHADL